MEKFPDQEHNTQEDTPKPIVEVEPEFTRFVPQEFLTDPVGYFEHEGKNIKTGEIKYDETGRVREDPTAVKDLPIWKNGQGLELKTVGKRVNTTKGAVRESDDPFYEYRILERLAQMGLPAAKPIAKAERADTHIIIMERIPGFRWSEKAHFDCITALMAEAEQKMNELKTRFDEAGVIRGWKLKDMVFEIDIENQKLISVTPTDWERTKIIEKK